MRVAKKIKKKSWIKTLIRNCIRIERHIIYLTYCNSPENSFLARLNAPIILLFYGFDNKILFFNKLNVGNFFY